MSQPTLQMPPEPLAFMNPDALDSVPAACSPDVAPAVRPFAGLGLHPAYSKKDRLIVSGLALLYAVYSLATRLQAVIHILPRR